MWRKGHGCKKNYSKIKKYKPIIMNTITSRPLAADLDENWFQKINGLKA
jgi:hypothetical protein